MRIWETMGRCSARVLARLADVPMPQSPRDCFIASLLLTLLLNGLLILNAAAFGPDDDLGIAMALSGMYPESGQCLFVNALLNDLIFALNSWQPGLNWFLIVERLSSGLAFFAICYCAMRYAPLAVALPVLGLIAYFIMPKCTVGSNFTVVAAICVAAGELCFCLGVSRGRWSSCLAGLFLVVLGYLWRALVLLLSAPFLALAFAVIAWRLSGRGFRFAVVVWLRAVGSVIAVGMLVGAAYFYDGAVWDRPEWASWRDYNDARYELVDYPVRPYGEVADDLEKIGVSSSDYWLMTNWFTADPDIMDEEMLRNVTAIAREPISGRTLWGSIASECAHLLRAFLFTGCLAFIVLLVGLVGGRRSAIFAVLSVAGAFAACVLFRYTGRLPMRVEYSTWLFSLLPCITSVLGFSGERQSRRTLSGAGRERVAAGLGLLLGALCLFGVAIKWLPTFDVAEVSQFQQNSEMAQTEELCRRFAEPGTVYVWDATTFTQVESALHYRHLPSRAMMESTVMAGGWTQRAPFVQAHNEKLGVSNPVRSLIERPDTYFVTQSEKAASYLLQYLREHYNERATCEIVDQIPLDDGKSRPILVIRFSAN